MKYSCHILHNIYGTFFHLGKKPSSSSTHKNIQLFLLSPEPVTHSTYTTWNTPRQKTDDMRKQTVQ
jgi:hypothetical protein